MMMRYVKPLDQPFVGVDRNVFATLSLFLTWGCPTPHYITTSPFSGERQRDYVVLFWRR